jgi:hypothetical protein
MATEQTEKSSAKRALNLFDSGMLVVVILAALGFFMAKAGHAGVNAAIKGSGPVLIEVSLTGVKTRDVNLFKVGEPCAVTIRNQPVQPPMTIRKVQHWPKQVSFLSPDGKKAISMPDPANPLAHDFLVVVEAKADTTSDGFVISGNKIKVGNQIDLESFKYREQGVVADIHWSSESSPEFSAPGESH